MRRRLWWQVVILDIRSSEDFGTDPSVGEYSFDVKLPLNVNDADLDPLNTQFLDPRDGVSEMTFCLIRYEILNSARRLAYTPPTGPCLERAKTFSLADKEQMLKELHEKLEDKYLKYCDSAGPLFWVAATVARLIVSKMSLIVYGFHQVGTVDTLPQHIKDRLFIASIEIMEYSQLLQTESATRKWGWLFHTYVQWHAIAYILREVCVRPYCDIVERGWSAVDGLFNSWGDAVKHSRHGQLWTPMRKLMLKARRKRQADMHAMGINIENLNHGAQGSKGAQRQQQTTAKPQANPADLGGIPDINFRQELESGTTHLRQDLLLPQYWPTPPEDQNDAQAQNLDAMAGYMAESDLQSMNTSNVGMGVSGYTNTNAAVPWLLDDSALTDLDMGAGDAEGEISWEGWDDVVRDFQMEVDMSQPDARGPNINGMGTWW